MVREVVQYNFNFVKFPGFICDPRCGLICDSRCGLYWRMFHEHLRRKCVLLHLVGMSWRNQWDPFHLMYHLRCVSLLVLSWFSAHWCEWGVKVLLLLCYCQFILLCLLLLVLRIEVLLCWVSKYLQLLCFPLGLIHSSLCNVLRYLL